MSYRGQPQCFPVLIQPPYVHFSLRFPLYSYISLLQSLNCNILSSSSFSFFVFLPPPSLSLHFFLLLFHFLHFYVSFLHLNSLHIFFPVFHLSASLISTYILLLICSLPSCSCKFVNFFFLLDFQNFPLPPPHSSGYLFLTTPSSLLLLLTFSRLPMFIHLPYAHFFLSFPIPYIPFQFFLYLLSFPSNYQSLHPKLSSCSCLLPCL